ncbi:TPA: hypothetical protein SI878_004399 [Salmonella enterica]|nr:hypothetical protein [Salmonella enterica]
MKTLAGFVRRNRFIINLSAVIIVAILAASLTGCASMPPVNEQSTAELCENGGYFAHNDRLDTADGNAIANELSRRWNNHSFVISESDCKAAMRRGVTRAINEEQRTAASNQALAYAMQGMNQANQQQQMSAYEQAQINQMQQLNMNLQTQRMDQQMRDYSATLQHDADKYGY